MNGIYKADFQKVHYMLVVCSSESALSLVHVIKELYNITYISSLVEYWKSNINNVKKKVHNRVDYRGAKRQKQPKTVQQLVEKALKKWSKSDGKLGAFLSSQLTRKSLLLGSFSDV